MNLSLDPGFTRRPSLLSRSLPLPALAFAIVMLSQPVAYNAEAGAAAETTPANDAAPTASEDEIISLAAYNVNADRIEDFGLRVTSSLYSRPPKTTAGFFLSKFAPIIVAVVPNTAAAKAGLEPGERIIKSEGQSTVGGLFSTGKFGQWHKIQAKKWSEVAAGKANVTWTLEVEGRGTKTVRTVKLMVPTPPPHWGASVWRKPEGRNPSVVTETGPLAACSRAVLDNGIRASLDPTYASGLGENFADGVAAGFPSGREPNGSEWHLGSESGGGGWHRIFVIQFRHQTDVFLETRSRTTGRRIYLTSPSGLLQKAWCWTRKANIARAKAKTKEAAANIGEVSLADARVGFEHEVDLWSTKVVSGRWPFEVKPGYDADAIFAVLQSQDAPPSTAEARRLPAEFLQLPPATEAQEDMFAAAYGKIGADGDNWAYTETSRGLDDKRSIVTRVDPSKPAAGRCVLLSIDGKAPTPAEIQQWRDDGGEMPKPLGDIPPLDGIVETKDLRVFKAETGAVVFELPIRSDNADFPAEKFQALFRVNQAQRSLEDIVIKLRETSRIAGVIKVTEAGLTMRFQTLDPALAPQPVHMKVGGTARVLLVKLSRAFETSRTDFKRVEPSFETLTP